MSPAGAMGKWFAFSANENHSRSTFAIFLPRYGDDVFCQEERFLARILNFPKGAKEGGGLAVAL